MLDKLIALDKDLLLFLNGLHAPFCDSLMFWISKTWVWIPLYLLILFGIFKAKTTTFDKIITVLAIALLVLSCDQIANLFKNWIERPRPTHDLQIGQFVHIVNDYRGGAFGFFSAHAANTFGVATFFSLFFKRKSFTIALLAWAAIVSYSRIYLGVHYPLDVFCGAAMGVILALFFFKIRQIFILKNNQKLKK